MEIYGAYQVIITILAMITRWVNLVLKMKTVFIIRAIGGTSILSVLFLLQAFGLYKMAKNRGIKNRALAFVPFVNIWFVGKLAGECHFFGQKVKRAGMYAMIAQIIGTLLCFLTIAAEMYLWIEHGTPQIDEQGVAYWIGLTGFDNRVSKFYILSGYFLSIVQLIYKMFLVVLFMGLYKQYSPKNYLALGLLTLFVPLSRYIIVFVLRKRKAIDYEAYMRAKREEYVRQCQQYHTPYGNPYQSPYGGQQGNSPTPPKPEEPFGEFTSSEADDEDDFFA